MPLRIRSHIEYPKKAEVEPVESFVRGAGLRVCKPWQPHEDAAVMASYHKYGSKVLAQKLGRDFRAVQSRARTLGIAVARAIPLPAE